LALADSLAATAPARDTRLTATRTEQCLEIDGIKGFCSTHRS